MACSDNVVRAGLTPKHRDVETLCSMLTYSCEPASAKRFQGIQEDEYTLRFSPPIPDFSVAKICVSMKHVHYQCLMPIYGVSQEECARLWESVPYVKLYRYNPKHLCPK